MARTKNAKVPEVGTEVPEFNLPSAQGGVLRLGMRTARGPVIVAFFRGTWSEDDTAFFEKLADKEDEINLALGNIVGIGVVESAAAREFVEASGIKSYILYDYAKVATPAWGLLEKDKERGEYARPATFLIDSENKVVEAWTEERPDPEELLAKVSEITGLPKEPEEEEEEKPKKTKAAKETDGEGGDAQDGKAEGASEKPKREKLSPEEREKRRAERKAARESGGGEVESKSGAGDSGEGGKSGEGSEPEAGESKAGSEAGEKGEKSAGGSEGSKAEDGSEGDSGESRSGKKEG